MLPIPTEVWDMLWDKGTAGNPFETTAMVPKIGQQFPQPVAIPMFLILRSLSSESLND
jgi:hypothetical protein